MPKSFRTSGRALYPTF